MHVLAIYVAKEETARHTKFSSLLQLVVLYPVNSFNAHS